MKSLSAIFVLGLLMTAPTSWVRANESMEESMQADDHWDAQKMQKTLGLSDDQTSKLKSLKDSEKEAMKPLWDKHKELMQTLEDQVKNKANDSDIQRTLSDLKTNKTDIRDRMDQFYDKKENILTPNQQAKMILEHKKHEMMKKHREGMAK